MSEMHILCGFDVPEFEKAIKLQLKTKGYDAVVHTQISKKGVKDFLEQNGNCDTVILQEIINNKKSYTAEEVAALTDKRDVNVIIVLSARHIGSEYVKTLYSAGITNAIFQKGRKDGASAKEIVELILNKRSRSEARRYYGIESQKIELGFIDDETYMGFYRKLHKDENLLKNYLEVCSDLSPKQIGDFTRRLPVDEKEYLAQFEEFHMLIDALKELGIDLKIKRPKKTSIGLKVPQQISVKGDGIYFGKSESVEDDTYKEVETPVSVAPSESSFTVDDIASDSLFTEVNEDDFSGLSIAELLKAAAMGDDTENKPADGPVIKEAEVEKVTATAPEVGEPVSEQEQGVIRIVKINPDEDPEVLRAREEASRREQESMESARKLEEEKARLEEQRKALEKEKAEHEKELARKEKQMQKEQQDAMREIEKERKAQEKRKREEIARRQREEALRARMEEEEDDDDEFELTYGGKQFSGGFLVVLIILVALAIGALFLIPYLNQMGFTL